MRAIIVDPAQRTISAEDLKLGGRDEACILAQRIGCEGIDLARISLVGKTYLYVVVDDFSMKKPNACFRVAGYHYPVAGRSIFIGADASGRSVDSPLSADQLEPMISWVEQATALAQVRAVNAVSAANHRARGATVKVSADGLSQEVSYRQEES